MRSLISVCDGEPTDSVHSAGDGKHLLNATDTLKELPCCSGNSTDILIAHAPEMLFRAFLESDLGAGPALKSLYLESDRSGIRHVWVHPECRYGVSPDGDDLFTKSGSDVHQTRIMCNQQPRLSNKGSGLVNAQFTTIVEHLFVGKGLQELFRCGCILITAQDEVKEVYEVDPKTGKKVKAKEKKEEQK